ncbi:FAD-binding protein (plasmid) [Deinococcus psychrotolerans]|uniref:D-lactate dehydrogenase (cytochrome) n=1 Tax=Deinococcus psychrotolerans TaxID=2489213 RepID=A0A3G8YRR8_9DEIO|nr:FAD-linked oxidase C-terminal domain-containing protein [Deinococcus psychrotolerans]AZI44461.1 FAD-binding protein [Deinococcus psychrotolerans]
MNSPVPNSSAFSELRAYFGERFSTVPDVLEQHGRDESRAERHLPDAVIFARSEDEVRRVMASASQFEIPIIPFAAGSSLEGQLIPVRGGISLDVSQMNTVLDIQPQGFLATVQAGVTYPALNRQARPHGLFFPVDPGAEASLGGMAATNASGTGAVRYGTMRDNVLSMRAVLIGGKVIQLGTQARKSSAGYDLRHLLIGSEGTLGVITELSVKLHPLPSELAVLRCHFRSVEAAAQCAASVMQAGLQPERLELMDERQMRAVNLHQGTRYPEAPTLWIELAAASRTALDEALALCAELCAAGGAGGVELARSETERQQLWQARHQAYYAARALHPGHAMLSTDLCVPLHELAPTIALTHRLCAENNLDASFVGHVGDGNFHVLFHAEPEDAATWQMIGRVYDLMVAAALAVGGTCSGEHGIGLHKRRHLRAQHGDLLELMRGIKALFDPQGLMNPGKIFEED